MKYLLNDVYDRKWDFGAPDNPFELDHEYGDDVHVVFDPLILSGLSRLGAGLEAKTLPLHDERAIVCGVYDRLLSHVALHSFLLWRAVTFAWTIS